MNYSVTAYYPYTNLVPTDIYPVQYGEQQCENNHSFGPCIRSNYLLHYVYSGEGIFKSNSTEYKLHKGQMFLIVPDQLAYYKADSENPWMYRWIEFNGSMSDKLLSSAELSASFPIYTDDENLSTGSALSDIVKSGDIEYERLMTKFWAFISSFSQNHSTADSSATHEYIRRAEIFIKINVHKKITVTDIAGHVGLDRSYLCRLFRQHKNISPQQYLLTIKMNTAAQYLKNTDISISEAAQSVGYADTHVFNKAFKNQFGASPTSWRQKQLWEKFIIQ